MSCPRRGTPILPGAAPRVLAIHLRMRRSSWDVAPLVTAEPAWTISWEKLPDFQLAKSAVDKSCPPSRTGTGSSPPARHRCAPWVTPGQSHLRGNRRDGVRNPKLSNSAFSFLIHAIFLFFLTQLYTRRHTHMLCTHTHTHTFAHPEPNPRLLPVPLRGIMAS